MNRCQLYRRFVINKELFECENCGNHVCEACFQTMQGICPNCFHKLVSAN